MKPALILTLVAFFLMFGCLTMGSGQNAVEVNLEGKSVYCLQKWEYSAGKVVTDSKCKATLAIGDDVYDCEFDLDTMQKNFTIKENCIIIVKS